MKSKPLLNPRLPLSAYGRVDLSRANAELGDALKDPESCQEFLDRVLRRNKKKVAYGGYLEKRGLYTGFEHFNKRDAAGREFHLGVDFWAPSGTSVHTPWAGRLHSWANRIIPGDYGPVVILEYEIPGEHFYGLYGHLSLETLSGLSEGLKFQAGEKIGSLGTAQENGGYAPHLHFQLIRDMQGFRGDYPGVCSAGDLEFYRQNCPDPLEFLNYGL